MLKSFPLSATCAITMKHTLTQAIYTAVLYTHFWLHTFYHDLILTILSIILPELIFNKRVLKSTMRSCEGIDGYAQHDSHDWHTVMNGMHDGEVLLHLLICFTCPILTCTCVYDTHTGYSRSFTITRSSMFLCRDYYYSKPVALWSYTPLHLH